MAVSGSAPAETSDPVSIRFSAASARFSLRGAAELAERFESVLGLALPVRIGARSEGAGLEALCLSPDEWIVQSDTIQAGTIAGELAGLYGATPHSLVDIADRDLTLHLSGTKTALLLSVGCPRNLARMTAGTGMRTVFDSVQVILWRDTLDAFRMDVARSYAPHVHTLLVSAKAEILADAARDTGR